VGRGGDRGGCLAAELLAGKFADGDKIKIDTDAHRFTFEKVG